MTYTRPLLLGQAPGPNTDPDYPLFPAPRTSAGGRLCEMMGLTKAQYLLAFDRANLLPYFPGRTQARDDSFPMAPARLAARVMRPLLRGRRVIMVGRRVAEAFRAPEIEWFEPWELHCGPRHAVLGCPGTAVVHVIPHPSGRNHWYNSELNRARARRFWDMLLRGEGQTDRNVLPFASG